MQRRPTGLCRLQSRHSGDEDLLARAAAEVRTLLTRDGGLLRRRLIIDARLVRGADPLEQLVDLVRRLRLGLWIRLYTRCTSCNGVSRSIFKTLVNPNGT